MPARNIAVPHQQDPYRRRRPRRPHAERHRPRRRGSSSATGATSVFPNRLGHAADAPGARPSRGCLSLQALLLPPGQWRRGPRLRGPPDEARSMSFTIAHITDPHLSPAPLPGFADLRLKRVMGYINWKRGRERLNDMAMLTRLVADLRAQRPDHVAVTGDLVNIGMPAEFRRAALWMETLGEPADVSFVPGNHDAYVRASMPLLEATFGPWTTGDAPRGGRPSLICAFAARSRSSASASGVPTGPLMATGRLGKSAARGVRRTVAARPAPRAWRGSCSSTTRRSPASRRRCAVFRTRRVRADRARPRRRGDPARPHPRAGGALASVARRAHGRRRGSGARRALRRGGRPRSALSRRLSPRAARPRGRALAGRRPGARPRAGKRGDRGTGGADGLRRDVQFSSARFEPNRTLSPDPRRNLSEGSLATAKAATRHSCARRRPVADEEAMSQTPGHKLRQ